MDKEEALKNLKNAIKEAEEWHKKNTKKVPEKSWYSFWKKK